MRKKAKIEQCDERESNPRLRHGKPECYHYTIDASFATQPCQFWRRKSQTHIIYDPQKVERLPSHVGYPSS